jgi:hypothetical protein
LTTYAKFDDDIDGWACSRAGHGSAYLTASEWHLIDELLLKLAVIATARASDVFAADLARRLRDCTADDATRDALRALAAQWSMPHVR